MGAGVAVHLVQMVDVVVMRTVETLGVSRTLVTVPEVTVCPAGQVVTVVETISVTMASDGAGVGSGGGKVGQSVTIPGFSGIWAAQMPCRKDSASEITSSLPPHDATHSMTNLVNSEFAQ